MSVTCTLGDGDVGGTVPATLALTLGTPANFGPFTPGLQKDYFATTTATVTSTAGDATLTVADPSATAPGHLVNGTFSLPEALQAAGLARRGTYARSAAGDPEDLRRPGRPTTRSTFVQAAGQGQRRAPYGHVQQDADLHAVDDDAVDGCRGAAFARRPAVFSRPRARARRGARRDPQRVVPERQARAASASIAAIRESSALLRSGAYLSWVMIWATSAVVRPSGKACEDLGRVPSAGARRAQRLVEVGDEHVVGLEGLEAAGLERPPWRFVKRMLGAV